MKAKIEINSLECLIASRVPKAKKTGDKVVLQPISVSSEIIDSYIKKFNSEKGEDIEIPEGKYQVVHIESIKKMKVRKGEDYYFFKLCYLNREKRLNGKADRNNIKKRTNFDYKQSEFPHNILYFMYFPLSQEIVSDSRCLNSVLTKIFSHIIDEGYEHYGQHGLIKSELITAIRLSVKNVLKDNFDEILKSEGFLKELSFTFVKPSESRKQSLVKANTAEIYEQLNEEAYALVPELISKIFGNNSEEKLFDKLPIKRFKIVFTPDEQSSGFKKLDKTGIEQIIKSDFLDASSIRYIDTPEGQIKRAFMRGVCYSFENELDWKKYEDDNAMKEEFLKHYFGYKNI